MKPRKLTELLNQLAQENVPFLPIEQLGLEESFLDDLYVTDYSFTEPTDGTFRTAVELLVYVAEGGELSLPGADFLSLSLVDEDQPEFMSLSVSIETTVTPVFSAELKIADIGIALQFKNDVLLRVEAIDGDYEITDDPFRIETQIDLAFNTDFEANVTIAEDGFDVPLFTIGETGLVCEVESFDFAISGQNPSVQVDRIHLILPDDIQPFGIPLPQLVFDDVQINATGFSGVINASWPLMHDDDNANRPYYYDVEGEPDARLFGFWGGIETIQVTIVDNRITGSALSGSLVLPYFDEPVAVTVRLMSTDEGLDFLVEIRSDGDTEIELRKEELIALYAKEISIQKDGSTGIIGVTGGMEPLLWSSDGLEWPRLDVTDLVFEQDLSDLREPPTIRFGEAWLDLKDLATLDLFGFHFELNRIGVGYVEESDKLWIDLTGSLKLIEQIPIGLGVEGFRITWPRTLHEELLALFGSSDIEEVLANPDALIALGARIEVRFDGIYIFYGVPQAVEFEGLIRFIKEDQVVGFAGDMALRLPATGLALEAGLMVGMNFEAPPYPFLYLYFGIQLPSGIPLGQSGLALKGAKGLFGLNVIPDKTPEQNPYYDWYKRGPIEGVHPTNKWRHYRWSVALGAGVTITTADGKILGIQGLLALVIPGPIIFIEGKTLIFQGVFPIDGPLKGLGYFDGGERTVQLNIEAGMELVEDVIDVNANVEAFFDFTDLTNWHVYLGQDTPADRRVRAQFLKLPAIGWLFSGSSYLMVDMTSQLTVNARLGVEIVFEPPAFDLEVAKVAIAARIDGEGLLSINPFEFSGELGLDADLEVDAFGLFGIQASADASIAAAGPRPLVVDAELAVAVELPIPDLSEVPVAGEWIDDAISWFEEEVAELPEIPSYLEFNVPFHWEYDGPPQIDAVVQSASMDRALSLSDRSVAMTPADTVTRNAAENSAVVALDAKPVISFDQPMNQAGDVKAADFIPGAAVRHFQSGDFKLKSTLVDIVVSRAPKDTDGALQWQEVGRVTRSLNSQQALWSSWRSERQLCGWTDSPFEWLIDQPPMTLAGPLDTAVLSHYLSDLSLTTNAEKPNLRCIGAQEFKKATIVRRRDDLAISSTQSQLQHTYSHSLRVDGVLFTALFLELSSNFVLLCQGLDVKSNALLIRFPESVAKAVIKFKNPGAVIKVHAFADSAGQLKRQGRDVQFVPGTPCSKFDSEANLSNGEHVLESDAGFDCLHVIGKGRLELQEVCWLSVAQLEEYEARQNQDAVNSSVSTQAPSSAPLMGRDYFYRVDVTTSTELVGNDHESLLSLLAAVDNQMASFLDEYQAPVAPKTQTFLYQTDGPPRNLERYLKWSSLDDVVNLFADEDILLRFRRGYIKDIFKSPFELDVLVVSADGTVIDDWKRQWLQAGSATLLPAEQDWRDKLQSDLSVVPPLINDDLLAISALSQPLDTAQRYTCLITGGEGGPMLIDERFDENELDTRWENQNNLWQVSQQLGATARAGSILWWSEGVDEIALFARVSVQRGDGLGVIVNHPHKRQDGHTFYELEMFQDRDNKLRLQLNVCSTKHSHKHTIDKKTVISTSDEFNLRAQIIHNQLNCHVGLTRVFSVKLERYVVEASQPFRPIRLPRRTTLRPPRVDPGSLRKRVVFEQALSGAFGFRAISGTPHLLRVRLSAPALLRIPFQTSRFRTFNQMIESADDRPPTKVLSIWEKSKLTAARDALMQLAQARAEYQRTYVDHAEMVSDRQTLDTAALQTRSAEAVVDAAFTDALGADAITEPVLKKLSIELLIFGQSVVGIGLRSPESLDLAMPVDSAPGRTSISLIKLSPGAQETVKVTQIATADGFRAVVYRAGGRAPGAFKPGRYQLEFTRVRDHGDDQTAPNEFGNRYDRPVHAIKGKRSPDVAVLEFDVM